jgi:hypothetical protein
MVLVRETSPALAARSACYVAIPWLLRPALPQAHATLNPDAPCFTRPPQYELTGACSPACGAVLGSLNRRSLLSTVARSIFVVRSTVVHATCARPSSWYLDGRMADTTAADATSDGQLLSSQGMWRSTRARVMW